MSVPTNPGAADLAASSSHIRLSAHPAWSRATFGADEANEVFARGYATVNGRFIESEGLAELLARTCARASAAGQDNRLDALLSLVAELDGCWAVIARTASGDVLAVADRIRSIPVFFACDGATLTISDRAVALVPQSGKRLARDAAFAFLMTGYVTGGETLIEGVEKLQAGEWLRWFPGAAGPQLKRGRYFRYYPTTLDPAPVERRLDEFADACDRVFEPYVEAMKDRPLRLALSGGYDSRLMAAMLRRHEASHVTCFSYGVPDRGEMNISKAVADALGFDFCFVPYTRDAWSQWSRRSDVASYWDDASNAASFPHMQELPALLELSENFSGDEGLQYLCGHSLDMPAGSKIAGLLKGGDGRPMDAVEAVLLKDCNKWPLEGDRVAMPEWQALRAKVEAQCRPPEGCEPNPVLQYEMWNAENRQALFIVNSVRAYEFVGAGWRVLWDRPLVDYFLKTPIELRRGESLYLQALRERIFDGPLAPLAHIPVYQEATSRVPTWRRRARLMLSRFGYFNAVNQWFSHLRPETYLLSQAWFADGRHPGDVRVGEVLQRYDVLEPMPSWLRAFIDPVLSHSLMALSWIPLLNLIVLGRLCAKLREEGGAP